MAAVFVIVFLFALASVLLFVEGLGAATFGTLAAGAVFFALATGVFLALFKMMKHWEEEAPTGE